MAERLNREDREYFKIHPNGAGCWAGRCPLCDQLFEALDHATTQLGVVRAIERHMDSHTSDDLKHEIAQYETVMVTR